MSACDQQLQPSATAVAKTSDKTEVSRARYVSKPCLFVLGHATLLLLMIPVLVGLRAILMLIGQRGADFVATFQVVLQIANFTMSIFSALNVGVFPQVAVASSANAYAHIGSIFRISSALAVVCGTAGALMMALLRKELFELFSKESERKTIIRLGEDALVLVSASLLPWLLLNTLASVYKGLGYMVQLVTISCMHLVVVCAFVLIMYHDHGLVAFGWGNIVGSSLSYFLLAGYLLCRRRNAHLYKFCAWSRTDVEAFKGILRMLGWVSVRSVFVQLQKLVSVALVTRLGLFYGAVYPVLGVRMASAYGAAVAIGYYLVPFLCSRLWGRNLRVLAFQLFTDYYKLGLSIALAATLYFSILGKSNLERQVADVVEEAEDVGAEIITWQVYTIFLMQCTVRALAQLYDGACIALEEVKGCAIAVIVGFAVFSVIAVAGRESFELIFFAELMFFAFRSVVLHCCLLRNNWSPLRNFPGDLILEAEWQDQLNQARQKHWFLFPLRRVYLSYVTTCLMATFDSRQAGQGDIDVVNVKHVQHPAPELEGDSSPPASAKRDSPTKASCDSMPVPIIEDVA